MRQFGSHGVQAGEYDTTILLFMTPSTCATKLVTRLLLLDVRTGRSCLPRSANYLSNRSHEAVHHQTYWLLSGASRRLYLRHKTVNDTVHHHILVLFRVLELYNSTA